MNLLCGNFSKFSISQGSAFSQLSGRTVNGFTVTTSPAIQGEVDEIRQRTFSWKRNFGVTSTKKSFFFLSVNWS